MPLPERPDIVDVHAHLCDPVFDKDREQVLERARTAGVASIIAVGEDLADAHRNLELAQKFPMIKPAAGLYPTRAGIPQAAEMVEFIKQHRSQLVAIGEVGLDYWVAGQDAQKELQREVLKTFIALSNELDLPLNIHSRSAGRHAIALLLEYGARKVHMHAFDGKFGAAVPGVEAGFFFSIPPSVIRSRQKQKLVRQLPLSCLLVETDSPVLGPAAPERNEPANILTAIQAIAQIKGMDPARVREAVYENTVRLYGLF